MVIKPVTLSKSTIMIMTAENAMESASTNAQFEVSDLPNKYPTSNMAIMTNKKRAAQIKVGILSIKPLDMRFV